MHKHFNAKISKENNELIFEMDHLNIDDSKNVALTSEEFARKSVQSWIKSHPDIVGEAEQIKIKLGNKNLTL